MSFIDFNEEHMTRSALLLAVLATGCGGPAADEAASMADDPPPSAEFAAVEPDTLIGPACEDVRRTVTATLGIATDLEWTTFQHPLEETPRAGCEISGVGDLETAPAPGQPGISLLAALREGDWDPLPRYDADGVDGYSGAVRREAILCFHFAEWQGPVDGPMEEHPVSESTEYRLRIQCTRDEPLSVHEER